MTHDEVPRILGVDTQQQRCKDVLLLVHRIGKIEAGVEREVTHYLKTEKMQVVAIGLGVKSVERNDA